MTKPTWREILLHGARTFPVVPWRAQHRWRTRPITLVVLLLGLIAFGIGEALIVDASVGNSPWTVLAQGLSMHIGRGIGTASLMVSALVLLLWIPLRERPGLGTILNAIIIGYALQFALPFLPHPTMWEAAVPQALLGILVVGFGSAGYITTNLGPGPRDGLMTALHDRTGVRVARVRTSIEIVALGIGWLLGGTIGLATLLFALLIGRSIALWLGLLARATHTA